MDRIVFRGDSRDPKDIFASGFTPKKTGGIVVSKGGQQSGGVSTSQDLGVAMRFAAAYDGWVYVAWFSFSKGLEVLHVMQKKGYEAGYKNAMTQMELAAEEISGDEVIAARRCRQVGANAEMYGDVVVNDGCKVDKKERDLALAFLGTNVTVPKEL